MVNLFVIEFRKIALLQAAFFKWPGKGFFVFNLFFKLITCSYGILLSPVVDHCGHFFGERNHEVAKNHHMHNKTNAWGMDYTASLRVTALDVTLTVIQISRI